MDRDSSWGVLFAAEVLTYQRGNVRSLTLVFVQLPHTLLLWSFLRWGHTVLCEIVDTAGPLYVTQTIREWTASGEMMLVGGRPKNSERNLSQCHFVGQSSQTDRPSRKHVSPRWEAGDSNPNHGTAPHTYAIVPTYTVGVKRLRAAL
jgi:hypothetical protein